MAIDGIVMGNAAIMNAAPSQNTMRSSGDAQAGRRECGAK
jgi:hypothetical protein